MSKIVDEMELSVEMRECRIKINKASQRYCPFGEWGAIQRIVRIEAVWA